MVSGNTEQTIKYYWSNLGITTTF